jgi:penicillin-binding protein 1A
MQSSDQDRIEPHLGRSPGGDHGSTSRTSVSHTQPSPPTSSRTTGWAPLSSDGMDAASIAAQQLLRRRWVFRLAVCAPLVMVAALLLIVGTSLIIYTLAYPNPMSLRVSERAPTIRVLAVDGTVLTERGQAADYVPIDLMPRHVIHAVVATEDRRFFDHWGIDPVGLVRAAFANLRARRLTQGGSTLTQQLAKNLFLSSERTFSRKIEELLLALWLEVRLSKSDILELYLNRVYFGGGAYGIEAAAQRYFDKSTQHLTIAEAAVIAGLLKAPSKYSPASNPVLARARARVVLGKMFAAGALTADAERAAANAPIAFHDTMKGNETTGVEYAVDFALERLPALIGGNHREVIIETTIDAALQKHAQAVVSQVIASEGVAGEAGQAGVVVLGLDGGIQALVGGRSYAESQFNRAAKARRQPGSVFKTFVYLAAIESGLTPDTTVYDLPVVVKGYSPRNENGTYRGAMPLRQGLAQSVNTVAVRLHMDLGPRKTVMMAQRLGIRSNLRDGPSLALGTSEVTLLELTGAYGVLANAGQSVEPHIIRRVRVSDGRVLYQRPEHRVTSLVAPVHVAAMNDMLNAALVSGTGKRAALPLHPAAGKTGTSQDFRDAWFVGYTSQLVGGVWVGNDTGRAMNRMMGGNLPARIWREVMTRAHAKRSVVALSGVTAPPRVSTDEVRANTALTTRDIQAGPNNTAQPLMPTERIDDDFVARMLSGPTGAPAKTEPVVRRGAEGVARPSPERKVASKTMGTSPPTAPPLWAGVHGGRFRDALQQRAPASDAPNGMMSLGARD